jgi:luciferase family oxidoreductase group 1
VIAEQFGTLETLYPGRIDLGLGRAPGNDQRTVQALRRSTSSAERFPEDVLELQRYFAPVTPGQAVRAVPGAGLEVPLWILGSSLYGAELAATLGLPYAFAAHFAPQALMRALEIYRSLFRPSKQLDRPYVMVAVNVCAADDDATARRLFTSAQQAFTNLVRGEPGQLPPPIDDIAEYWTGLEQAQASSMLECSFVGAPGAVGAGLERFAAETGADEIMAASAIYDHAARLRSYDLLAQASSQDSRVSE